MKTSDNVSGDNVSSNIHSTTQHRPRTVREQGRRVFPGRAARVGPSRRRSLAAMASRRLALAIVAAGLSAALAGCISEGTIGQGSTSGDGGPACQAGEVKSCVCPGGLIGVQECEGDGFGWHVCDDCSAPDAGAALPDGGWDEFGTDAGGGGGMICVAPGDECEPTFPDLDSDPCCDDSQDYHCCPIFRVCVIDCWR